MKRKYLDDIGVTDRPDIWEEDIWGETDRRWDLCEKQREIYGFDERETWNLDVTFYLWLYERLKMFVEKAGSIIDLDYPNRFEYNGKKYTQREMIDMMLERLEFSFRENYNEDYEDQRNYISEIEKIWAIVLPAMWW